MREICCSEKYQKEVLYNHYLPYEGQLDQESDAWLLQIKTNLARATLLRWILSSLKGQCRQIFILYCYFFFR